MTFTLYKKYIFRPDLSNNLTGDEIVTTLHPGNVNENKNKIGIKSIALKYLNLLLNDYMCDLNQLSINCAYCTSYIDCKSIIILLFVYYMVFEVLAGIGLTVHSEFRQFLHVAVAAIKEIFYEPADAFWTGRAMSLLSDGIDIDCDVTNPLSRIACKEMRKSGNPAIQLIDQTHMKFSLIGGVS